MLDCRKVGISVFKCWNWRVAFQEAERVVGGWERGRPGEVPGRGEYIYIYILLYLYSIYYDIYILQYIL